MNEKFCLKWNDFESNISKTFPKLRGETELFDVTLVGQDQKKVSAHRLVLSACSDFFKNIFYSNSHSHPLLYLDGVDSSEVNLMLDYIYQGEVQIHQEHLDRFLEVANKFKLEGLIGAETNDEDSADTKTQYEEVDNMIQGKTHTENVRSQSYAPKAKKEMAIRLIKDPSEMIDASNVDVNQMYQELIVKEEGNFRCTVCGRTMGHKASMERHVETHMTGLCYDCKYCGETFRSRMILKHHVRKHK